MTDRYWISNALTSTANTAGNWNTVADGTGSTGVPAASDDVYFGHADTLAANLGNGACIWNLALTLGKMTTTNEYVGFTHTATNISFTTPNTITMADGDWASLGFRVGMVITISGAATAANNNAFAILSITDNVIVTTSVAIVTEAAGPSISVQYQASIDLQDNIGLNLLILKTTLQNSTGSKKTISFAGTYDASADSRYILNGRNTTILNQEHIEYSLDSSANGVNPMFFDSGPHPLVVLSGSGKWSCGYKAPASGIAGSTDLYGLSVGSSTTMAIDSTATPIQNESKVFNLLNTSRFLFSPIASSFEAGKSTWTFTMDITGFAFPVSDDTKKYNWYNIVLKTPNTAGFKATIPSNRTLSINSLTVEADAVLEGHKTVGDITSTVVSVRRPKILGAWNFSQISDGIYASLLDTAFPITPASGLVGRVQISDGSGAFTNDEKLTWTSATSTLLVDGKLTVTGLIDPTGMEFTAVGANPSSANPAKTIWVNSGDSNKLYFGSSEVGGGGGGITALTGDVTASGSGSVAATIANDSVNDDKLANTTLAKIDGALPKAGGTMTGEIEATTITLNAVPADPATDDKVRIGESGGSSNMFQIQTNDGYIQLGPNNTGYAHIQTDRSRFYFNKEIIIDGGGYVLAYNDGLKLGTGTNSGSGTTAITIADGSTDITVAGQTESTAFVKTGGASTEFLMADGSVTTGATQYQKYVLQDLIGSPVAISAGTTTQLTFGTTGAVFVETYTTPTAWITDPISSDHIIIQEAGLYQFTFGAFLAGISGSNPDYRITISSTSSLTGDLLSLRNRTSTIDRYTNTAVTTVYLGVGDTVYFSVFCGGMTYQVGGLVAPTPPITTGETRTYLDIRKV